MNFYTVLAISPVYEGKEHDKSIYDQKQIRFEKPVVLWEDFGFAGLDPVNEQMRPVKKYEKKEPTPEEKAFNHQVSGRRVKVEHTIGQCKIFRIVKEEVRAFKEDFRATYMLLACTLNNFKMDFVKS